MKPRLLLVVLSPAAQLVILSGPFVQIGVAQLGLPASLVGGLVALQMATALLRPWLGRLGDRLRQGSRGRLQLLRGALVVQWLTLPLVLLGLLRLGEGWSRFSGAERLVAVAAEVLLVLLLGSARDGANEGQILFSYFTSGGRELDEDLNARGGLITTNSETGLSGNWFEPTLDIFGTSTTFL